jgi:hypothetical protein
MALFGFLTQVKEDILEYWNNGIMEGWVILNKDMGRKESG